MDHPAPKTSKHGHDVEPPYVVVTNFTALPPRCFVTNEPLDESEYHVWDLPRIPRWLFTLGFISPFLLMTAPFVHVRCKVKAGLCRKERRKRLFVKTVMILALLTPVWAVLLALATRNLIFVPMIMVGLVLAQLGLPVLVLLLPPLRVVRHSGDLFWIKGCSPAYLASLGQEADGAT